jgi:hypothetical protein
LNAAVSKTVVRLIGVPGVRISPPPFFAGRRSLFELWAYCMSLICSRLRATRAVVCSLMVVQSRRYEEDLEGERVRRLRLRADGRRPLVVNLEETILLTRKLFELRDAALRAR